MNGALKLTSGIKLTIEFVKKEFKKERYILLTKEYINCRQKLEYICPNGHKHNIRWLNWQQGYRCPYCYGNISPTIEFIKYELEKEGYKLFSKSYKNNHTKLKYICCKGHKGTVTWNNWAAGVRCFMCKCIKQSGPGNPAWKGGISCEPYCFEWSSKEFKDFIKERDGNRCLNPICHSKNPNDLTIHHINYNKKNCNPSNLITLCRSCNSRANFNRDWHESWYNTIIFKRYGYDQKIMG